jgi:hypothetical protein
LELLTTCLNQAMNDEYQHFGNMIAAKLRNCNGTVRCIIQNEIMGLFLNANKGFYERYQHTHLHPNEPPEAHFPSGPSNMYPVADDINLLQSIIVQRSIFFYIFDSNT